MIVQNKLVFADDLPIIRAISIRANRGEGS